MARKNRNGKEAPASSDYRPTPKATSQILQSGRRFGNVDGSGTVKLQDADRIALESQLTEAGAVVGKEIEEGPAGGRAGVVWEMSAAAHEGAMSFLRANGAPQIQN